MTDDPGLSCRAPPPRAVRGRPGGRRRTRGCWPFWFEETAPVWWLGRTYGFDAGVRARSVRPRTRSPRPACYDGWRLLPELGGAWRWRSCLDLRLPRHVFEGGPVPFATDDRPWAWRAGRIGRWVRLAITPEDQQMVPLPALRALRGSCRQRICVALMRSPHPLCPAFPALSQVARISRLSSSWFGRFPHTQTPSWAARDDREEAAFPGRPSGLLKRRAGRLTVSGLAGGAIRATMRPRRESPLQFQPRRILSMALIDGLGPVIFWRSRILEQDATASGSAWASPPSRRRLGTKGLGHGELLRSMFRAGLCRTARRSIDRHEVHLMALRPLY